MRIGIITYWDSTDNYGQQLQCYALQTYLRNKGHDAYLIRYAPIRKKGLLKRCLAPLKLFADLLLPVRRRKRMHERKNHDIWLHVHKINKKRCFEDFRNKELLQTSKVYHSIKELRKNPPKADLYITGSDQVWNNPLDNPNTAGWFLDFGKGNIKRASYAASMGRTLKDNEINLFKGFLSKFDSISVREGKALALCHSIGFKDAIITVDPTLLLDKSTYKKIEGYSLTEVKRPYIFIYVLNVRSSDEIFWADIQKLYESKNLDVKCVVSSGYLPACDIIPNVSNILATIPEWLELIDKSTVVFTTSFHGIVFCILYHKPFYAILLQNEFSQGNDRIITLLNDLGLEQRIVRNDNKTNFKAVDDIDWESVDKILSVKRNDSFDYLSELCKSVNK